MNAVETVQSLYDKGYTALQVVHSAKAKRALVLKTGNAREKGVWNKTVRLAEEKLADAYAGGLACNIECMTTLVPVEKCRCSCKGVNHGKNAARAAQAA